MGWASPTEPGPLAKVAVTFARIGGDAIAMRLYGMLYCVESLSSRQLDASGFARTHARFLRAGVVLRLTAFGKIGSLASK
jgi:hypothetical protein